MLGAVLVDQAADRAAGGVVHAGDAAGADGDELLLRERAGALQASAADAAAATASVGERGSAGHVGLLAVVESDQTDSWTARARAPRCRIDRRAEALDDRVELAVGDDERRREQHVVAMRPSTVPPIG